MVGPQYPKGRSNRSASIHCINTSVTGRRSSQDINGWRNKYYFHGKEIGRGHFAKVYHVTCTADQRECAAKVIRRRRGGADRLESIREEMRIMQKLWTDGGVRSVVQPFDIHEDLLEVALVMELAHGGSIFHVAQKHHQGLPESYVQVVTKKLLLALSVLHSYNVVHLDIKADNILLRKPYPSTDIALCDFGLAVQLNEEKIHRELVGTPDYIAPEIINYEQITISTDMWSVGVLTFFLLCSKSPFLGETKEATMMNVSKIEYSFPSILFDDSRTPSKDFISRLIVKQPSHRISSRQCLEHEWLVNVELEDMEYPEYCTEACVEFRDDSNKLVVKKPMRSVSQIEEISELEELSGTVDQLSELESISEPSSASLKLPKSRIKSSVSSMDEVKSESDWGYDSLLCDCAFVKVQ